VDAATLASLTGERRAPLAVEAGRQVTVTIPRFATTAVVFILEAGER
jgi:hypothetical protein